MAQRHDGDREEEVKASADHLILRECPLCSTPLPFPYHISTHIHFKIALQFCFIVHSLLIPIVLLIPYASSPTLQSISLSSVVSLHFSHAFLLHFSQKRLCLLHTLQHRARLSTLITLTSQRRNQHALHKIGHRGGARCCPRDICSDLHILRSFKHDMSSGRRSFGIDIQHRFHQRGPFELKLDSGDRHYVDLQQHHGGRVHHLGGGTGAYHRHGLLHLLRNHRGRDASGAWYRHRQQYRARVGRS